MVFQYCAYLSGSLYIVFIIAGQGFFMVINPPSFAGRGFPFLSTIAGSMPGNGFAAEPGFNAMHGRGVTSIMPVSVCHHVSIIGSLLPVTFLYQSHASGFIGSPTEPSILRVDRSYFLGQSSPYFIRSRMAVGVV